MARMVRFLKLSFLIGGSASVLSLFTSADNGFSIETLKQLATSKIEPSSKEVLEDLSAADETEQPYQKVQTEVEKSEQDRARKAIVRYKEVDYVLINGKYYPYNPKNIYVINGVTTFFKPGGYDKMRTARANARIERLQKQHNVSHTGLMRKADGLLKNPLKGYSRKGIREMQETIEEIKRSANARNRALESLAAE